MHIKYELEYGCGPTYRDILRDLIALIVLAAGVVCILLPVYCHRSHKCRAEYTVKLAVHYTILGYTNS